MVNVITVILICGGVVVFGGGLGYLIWVKTRPKKQVWKARVYQLGESTHTEYRKKGKEIVGEYELNDLKPFAMDFLEKIEREPGLTIYRLQKLNKVCPEVNSDYVERWGDKERYVNVLYHKGECTLLKKGYDPLVGNALFKPMSHEKINLIKSEMAIRKERLNKSKDILQAISPFVTVGLALIALVAIVYLSVQGAVEIAELNKESATQISGALSNTMDQLQKLTDLQTGVEIVPGQNIGPPSVITTNSTNEIPKIE